MTQPSINTTFDTSLIDLNPNVSFSTTESDPSDASIPSTIQTVQAPTLSLFQQDFNQDTSQPSQTVPQKTSTPVQHIGTQDAYDQWASIYDSDGNMLQSIDDDELETLLPSLLEQVLQLSGSSISILDLGCGTGRNTVRLLCYPWLADRRVSVTGLDFSAGMLSLARTKLSSLPMSPSLTLKLEQCNPFSSTHSFSPSSLNIPLQNFVISTLVLEHIPLRTYFSTLSALLLPNGIALVTNMHSQMGSRSQAGFVNAQGIKVRGESFVYSMAETVQAAKEVGFDLLQAKERSVEEEDMRSGVVGERGGKWIGCKVWFGVVLQKA